MKVELWTDKTQIIQENALSTYIDLNGIFADNSPPNVSTFDVFSDP